MTLFNDAKTLKKNRSPFLDVRFVPCVVTFFSQLQLYCFPEVIAVCPLKSKKTLDDFVSNIFVMLKPTYDSQSPNSYPHTVSEGGGDLAESRNKNTEKTGGDPLDFLWGYFPSKTHLIYM